MFSRDPRKESFLFIFKAIPVAELFNIPDWDCPDTVKAPFYEGLERNEHSMSPILWLGVVVFGMASLGLCYWNAHSIPHSKNWSAFAFGKICYV